MYIPRHFVVEDHDTVLQFIARHAFGQLISQRNGRPYSTHLPFMLSEQGDCLLAHLARSNPQLDGLDGQQVLVTLQGAHGYISPTWYTEPGVPTWNYQAVHVYGQCRLFEDGNRLQTLVEQLSQVYESSSREPWQPVYKASMLRAIVGVEIPLDELQCKFKLSQNRSEADRLAVIEQLEQRGETALATEMRLQLQRERD